MTNTDDDHVEDHSLENDERVRNWGRQLDGSGPGKKKGSSAKQRATARLKYAIQCKQSFLLKRLLTLAKHPEGPTAIAAIRTLLAYGWGRPTVHVEVEGTITKRYVAVMPPTMEHEEWMKMVQTNSLPLPHEAPITTTNGHPSAATNGHLGKS